jgi:hypothetical protein
MLIAAMLYWLIPLIVLAAAMDPGLSGLRAAGLLATILSAAFWMLISLGMRIPVIYGLAYPLGVLMALYIILRSTWRRGRRVEWKGRVYTDEA